MKLCVVRRKKTQGVFMIKFKVGKEELTHEELLSKVGAGRISHDHYKDIIAAHNDAQAPVASEEKPVIVKTGKKKAVEDANGTES